MSEIMKFEKEELIRKNEAILKEKDEMIKQRVKNKKFLIIFYKVNNLKIENDVLKNEIFDLKSLNSTYLADAETYKLKYKDLKSSNSADKTIRKNMIN